MTTQTLHIDHAGAVTGPAPAVPGAPHGGSITLLADAPPEHTDPQQAYIGTTLAVAVPFFHRTLTSYLEDPVTGRLTVVGDLATSAGSTPDGGRTWVYRLRDGLAYEDGRPVTAADVAHGVARSFGAAGRYGPKFVQRALDPYGRHDGGTGTAPGLHTPDDRTIVFTLPSPHPEFPFLAALTTTTPVPADRDTGAAYEHQWLSTGPYRVTSRRPGEHYLLERNPHWIPESDPVRHQYVDTIRWQFGVDRAAQTRRLLDPEPADAAAIATTDVDPDQVDRVLADPALLARTLAGPTSYLQYVYINTTLVPDIAVRRALNLAFDRESYIAAAGGAAAAEPATTLLAPAVPGYRHHDAYPAGPGGDPERAKQLLAGRRPPRLRYAYPDIAPLHPLARVVREGLGRAGFDVVPEPVDKGSYYGIVGRRDSPYDLVWGVWGPDFPDPAGVLDVLFRGDLIGPAGNMNLSYLDIPDLTQRLAALRREPDRGAAAVGYGRLDEEIMARHAPVVPVFYKRQFSLYGPRVGGLHLSSLYSFPALTNVYVAG